MLGSTQRLDIQVSTDPLDSSLHPHQGQGLKAVQTYEPPPRNPRNLHQSEWTYDLYMPCDFHSCGLSQNPTRPLFQLESRLTLTVQVASERDRKTGAPGAQLRLLSPGFMWCRLYERAARGQCGRAPRGSAVQRRRLPQAQPGGLAARLRCARSAIGKQVPPDIYYTIQHVILM